MGKLLIMAWRNVWRNWRRTVIAGIAIALGLTLILFFDGMLNGMDEALYGNTVRLQGGNVQVHAPGFREKSNSLPLLPLADPGATVEAALAQTNVIAVSQRIRTGGMVSSREGTLPVAITGVEPEQEAPVSLAAENVVQGRWLEANDEDVLLIGQAMAERLEVTIGDRVTLVGRATHQQMRRRTMTIVGIYDIGIPDVEKSLVYVSLLEAQTLFDLRDQATEIAIYLAQVGQEPPVVEMLQAALPGYEVDAWDTLDPSLKEMMEMEDQMMGIFGLVILLIAGVGILNLMLMAVFERTREIGLLAAMGLKRREIVALFLLEGVMIGLLGALAGCVLGGGIGAYFGRVGIDLMAIYGGEVDVSEFGELYGLMGDRLYVRIGIGVLAERALTVGVIAALASLYPAWQASKREPAEAL
ncbi:MAG: FtsX-like permease family protein, partial [Chloroflexota bacterium]|nr:FtsX-like permease family protein [Chloroflexota bacterium]